MPKKKMIPKDSEITPDEMAELRASTTKSIAQHFKDNIKMWEIAGYRIELRTTTRTNVAALLQGRDWLMWFIDSIGKPLLVAHSRKTPEQWEQYYNNTIFQELPEYLELTKMIRDFKYHWNRRPACLKAEQLRREDEY